ncbi:hypothetical protein CAL29_26325 [Bordetella genomosp. 10]|uniref:LacI family transcriptional regulator n=1 Tax=Bordetella genomosp. 10 TaxID=1416804 RepID=A0A261S4M1_9BORD|nr:tripartite tricarboxylate transporter substrate binding protein [Bordetella genomosp. 10]OZI31423.1 hypothetical protein CAL29_26325 [Bordetella genomosp. 10]
MKPMSQSVARFVAAGAIACLAALTARGAHAAGDDAAKDYPSKPITLLVGFPAGGPADNAARLLVDRIVTKWPQAKIIVQNRGGANGAIAATELTKAPADGYTLFFVTRSHVNLKWLTPNLPFNPETDFQPVAIVLDVPNVMVVGPSVKAPDYAAFVKDVAAHPNQYTAFSSGNGSDPHLALAEYMQKSGLRIRHIPYKGGNEGMLDMLAGRVDLSFATLGTVMSQLRKGKLRALAIGGKARSPQLPDVPTFAEVGVKDFSPEAWYGVMAPKGTPPAIVAKLNATINEVMNTPEGAKKLETLGAVPVRNTVDDFTAIYKHDLKTNGELIQRLGIHID